MFNSKCMLGKCDFIISVTHRTHTYKVLSWKTGTTWPVVGKLEGIQGIKMSKLLAEGIGCPEAVPTWIWVAVGSTFLLDELLVKKWPLAPESTIYE